MAHVCQDSSAIAESPHIVIRQRAREKLRVEDMTPVSPTEPRTNWSYEDDSPPHTVGGAAGALMRVHEQAQGIDKIIALLSGQVSRTQASHRAAWRHWILFALVAIDYRGCILRNQGGAIPRYSSLRMHIGYSGCIRGLFGQSFRVYGFFHIVEGGRFLAYGSAL